MPESDRVEPPASPIVSNLSEEELVVAIRKQLEYYFSKENLQQDAYLTSQMDGNMSVPITTIMSVSKFPSPHILIIS